METLSLIVAIISGIVAVVSVVFSIITYKKSVVHDRKQATLEAFNRLQTEAFDHLNLMSPANIREICEDPKCEAYKILSSYVARIEHFCVGVKNDIYDRDTVYELAHGYLDGKMLMDRIGPLMFTKSRGGVNYYDHITYVLQWMEKRDKGE